MSRYTGRRWDDETGLYYYRARYYSAKLGRFMQTDPIGYEDNMNLYGYTANDPVNNTDPTGMFGDRTQNYQPRPRTEVDGAAEFKKARARGGSLSRATSVVNNPDEPARQMANTVAENSLKLLGGGVAFQAGKGILGAMAVGGTAAGVTAATAGGDENEILAATVVGALSTGKAKLLAPSPAAQRISGLTDGIVGAVVIDAADGDVNLGDTIGDVIQDATLEVDRDENEN